MVRLLAEKCADPEYRRKMRLILVNYSEPFERLLPAAVANEVIPIPSVNKQNLIECLTQLNEQRRRAGHPPLADLETIADGMLAGAPKASGPRTTEKMRRTTEKMRLRYLYDGLRAVAMAPALRG